LGLDVEQGKNPLRLLTAGILVVMDDIGGVGWLWYVILFWLVSQNAVMLAARRKQEAV
jgi:hypothetical protein